MDAIDKWTIFSEKMCPQVMATSAGHSLIPFRDRPKLQSPETQKPEHGETNERNSELCYGDVYNLLIDTANRISVFVPRGSFYLGRQ